MLNSKKSERTQTLSKLETGIASAYAVPFEWFSERRDWI